MARKATPPPFQTSDRCVACHNGVVTSSGEDISIGAAWRPTMMANAARDPYWQAGVRREIMDHPESRAAIEDECSICHMPMARFESKLGGHQGTVFSHLGFLPDVRGDSLAADGVSCSLCHQIGKEKLGTRESFVGGFTIGPPNAQGERPEFGPYETDAGHTRIMRTSTGGFVPTQAPHIRQSEVCATCHTLITKALGAGGAEIGELPEQVPYQEWLHSEYREKRSCQSCHMPVVNEDVAITSVLGQARAGVSRHVFVGGNFFLQRMLNRYRNELGVAALPEELTAAAERTVAHLRSESARVSVGGLEVRGGRLEAEVSIENLGGHKLPTAYPSRRVWLHVVVRDGNNRTVFESGAVNAAGSIQGNDNDDDPARFEPHYTEIRGAGQVQIYEAIMGDSRGAVTTGLLNALSYLKDNRLLPKGFDKRTAGKDVAVAGGALDDADFSGGGDRVRYSVELGGAPGPFRMEAELCYQPVAYRWAMNLKRYDAEEPRRFTGYYEAMAPASMVVIARAQATR
ncbi:MAG: multiheme c-type cytochrome [Candidatus Solibacter sp.]|nr:multiheme c-type cytochrome [Candidatus Solibacter sp.]